jgi:hypothetical protein
MAILNLAALGKLRNVVNLHMPDSCRVYRRPAATSSDFGQEASATYPTDWSTVGSPTESCRFVSTQRTSKESSNGAQVQSMTDGKLYLRFDMPEVKAGDRIRITTRNPVGTFDLEVVGTINRSDRLSTDVDVLKVS